MLTRKILRVIFRILTEINKLIHKQAKHVGLGGYWLLVSVLKQKP